MRGISCRQVLQESEVLLAAEHPGLSVVSDLALAIEATYKILDHLSFPGQQFRYLCYGRKMQWQGFAQACLFEDKFEVALTRYR